MAFDPYRILGVAADASVDEIRQAYRALARKFHPDVNRDPGAEETFKLLGQAYSILTDRRRRALYDEFGEASLSLQFDPRQAQRQRPPQRPAGDGSPPPWGPRSGGSHSGEADIYTLLEIDLPLAITGGPVRVTPPQGGAPVELSIPPGAQPGSQLRVPGRGRPSVRSSGPGDLIFEVRVRPHPFFRREGPDLHLTLPVTISEAHYGGRIEIPTPEGWVQLTIPAGSQGGELLRLRGKGLAQPAGGRGDLLVQLCIRLPELLDSAGRSLDRLETLYRQPVRQGLRF